MGIDAANRMTYRRLVLLLADWISRRKMRSYIARASQLAGSLALRLWDKSNNFRPYSLQTRLEKEPAVREQVRHKMTTIISSRSRISAQL